MKISELNGWQRLWVLMSVIYFFIVLAIGYSYFPTADNKFLADYEGEIQMNLSEQTLVILSQSHMERMTNIIGKQGTLMDREFENFIWLPTGGEIYMPPTKFTQKDKDNLLKDYRTAISNVLNKKRLIFLLYMLAFWAVPCLSLYALGFSFIWVYRGFNKNKKA
jgi:hypothetical protein